METYEFTIVASGLVPEEEDFEDRLFEIGGGDATRRPEGRDHAGFKGILPSGRE
jgi:hypothetical protein